MLEYCVLLAERVGKVWWTAIGYGDVFGDFAALGVVGTGNCCKGLDLKQRNYY